MPFWSMHNPDHYNDHIDVYIYRNDDFNLNYHNIHDYVRSLDSV